MAVMVTVDIGREVDDRCPVEFGEFGTFAALLDRLLIGPVARLAVLWMREL